MMMEWHGMLQAAAREARANQIKLDAQQLESLLFQLFERKVGQFSFYGPPSPPLPLVCICVSCAQGSSVERAVPHQQHQLHLQEPCVCDAVRTGSQLLVAPFVNTQLLASRPHSCDMMCCCDKCSMTSAGSVTLTPTLKCPCRLLGG